MKQIIRKLEEQEEHHDLKTSIHSLRELAEYYKEIYTLLCAQATGRLTPDTLNARNSLRTSSEKSG